MTMQQNSSRSKKKKTGSHLGIPFPFGGCAFKLYQLLLANSVTLILCTDVMQWYSKYNNHGPNNRLANRINQCHIACMQSASERGIIDFSGAGVLMGKLTNCQTLTGVWGLIEMQKAQAPKQQQQQQRQQTPETRWRFRLINKSKRHTRNVSCAAT